jgi:hypothetical protein
VTLPFSTKVLTSNLARTASAANAESMRDWIEASSTGVAISPPDTVGDCCTEGLVCGVGEPVGEGLADGDVMGPLGTVCCGASEDVSGSKGRLVIKSAKKVASAAATMTLMAIQSSFVPVAGFGRFGCAWRRDDASTTKRLLGVRGSGTWFLFRAEIISYTICSTLIPDAAKLLS